LGSCYLQTSRTAEGIAILSEFDTHYPDSLLKRDARVLYANALLNEGRAQEVVDLLEKDRDPIRSDIEFTLGKAYESLNQVPKASGIFRNLYFTMPLSVEATQADLELKKMDFSQLPQPTYSDRKTRADLLLKGRRYSDAADEYRALTDLADPTV